MNKVRKRLKAAENGYELWRLSQRELPDTHAIKHKRTGFDSAKFESESSALNSWDSWRDLPEPRELGAA